jgi:glycosyltransferase involved in cell wall biosynthesis
LAITCAVVHNHPIHYKHLLFCALAKLGLEFEVLFVAGSSSQRIERPLPTRNEYRYTIGFEGPYEGATAIATAKYIWSTLNRLSPRVVIIAGYYDIADWTALAWSILNRKHAILWAESNAFDRPRGFLKEAVKSVFVKNCHCAHVYGKTNADYIAQLGMPRARIYIKRAVANTDLFLSSETIVSPVKTGPLRLLYVGRFAEEKNLGFLLRAFARVTQATKTPRIVLELVGYGPLERQLRSLSVELGIESIVTFPGKALQSDLPAIYRRADVFVLPSVYEPWGLVAIEAMLCGLPVLASTQCGCTGDLDIPKTGWSFSPYDLTTLAELLEMLSHVDRARLREMGAAARTLASQYSPENCATIVYGSVAEAAL